MDHTSSRPNILWIMTDQHKPAALSCLVRAGAAASCFGVDRPLTPNLDALAQDGVLFENAYSPSPVCGPARTCMKTGKYPPANGAVKNWAPMKEGNAFLPQLLKEAGYQTGMAGKLHLFPPEADYGFQVRHLSDAPYSVYSDDDKHSEYIQWLRKTSFDKKGIDPVTLFDEDESAYDSDLRRFMMGSCFRSREEHETDWTTDRTLDFLEKDWDQKRPFFFYTSYFGPHQPYGAPAPYDAFCSPEEIQLPESYFQQKLDGCPVFSEKSKALYDHVRKSLTQQDCKELIAAYLGQVHMIDESIGRIIRYLKEKGLYENTMLVFSSDHGDHLAEHGLFFKSEMYDSCVKVPLIIKPVQGVKGKQRSELVNTIDLFATLLELAQAEPPKGPGAENLESRSLTPLLSEQDVSWENVTYSIIGGERDHALSMVREGDWKLIRLAHGPKEAVYELYDLRQDPEELCNRYEDGSCQKVRERLKALLEPWFSRQYALYAKEVSQ